MESIYEALGLSAGGTLVVLEVAFLDWGQTLALRGEHRADDGHVVRFRLAFTNCRELRWRAYVHAVGPDEALLVDVALGRSAHRSPAQLLSDRFGLSVWYGEVGINREA